jgi:hypothetical protein
VPLFVKVEVGGVIDDLESLARELRRSNHP